jgi:hypothetical protein
VANSNKRINSIKLLVNGSITFDQTKIRKHIVQFYNILFTEQFSWWPKLDSLAFDSINEEATTLLERLFVERGP